MHLTNFRKLAPIALFLIILIQACALPAEIHKDSPVMQVEAGQGNPIRYMVVAADATPTPTPFQPSKITPTPTPTATPTLIPTPTVTLTPTLAIAIPNQDGTTKFKDVPPGGPLPDGVVNIMVLGSDARPGGGYRTDVMMLVSINRDNKTVSVISFPRDLYVSISGWQTNRLNTAMQVGGFNTLATTFKSNFGVRPDYYVMTNFNGFKAIIDSMGGIDVKIQKSLKDTCDLPWGNGAGICELNAPNTVPMNGADALWYVRSRHSTSDFDRQRRAQEVIRAIFVRLMSLDVVPRLPDIFSIYQKNVETNLTLDQILPLIPVAQEVIKDPNQVQRFALTPAEAIPFVTAEGAMVLWPNLPAIQAIVRQAIFH
jgi:polyisoprenyl-teichoic acid--peptidoglycan teichoic acid transferase